MDEKSPLIEAFVAIENLKRSISSFEDNNKNSEKEINALLKSLNSLKLHSDIRFSAFKEYSIVIRQSSFFGKWNFYTQINCTNHSSYDEYISIEELLLIVKVDQIIDLIHRVVITLNPEL